MTDPATPESDRDPGKGRLFDWKRSGHYAWKSSFPLTQVDRAGRPGGGQGHGAPAPDAPKDEPKLVAVPLPAAPKPSAG